MLIYVLVNIFIIVLGVSLELLNRINTNRRKLPSYFFIVPSFILLFIISTFRGDFTVDYKNYLYLFELFNRYSFFDLLQIDFYQEKGFILLNKLIGTFTSNEIYLFVVTTMIILISFYSQFNKYSSYIWLSVLMFVTIGSFYTSFNTMRQILAVAIIFAGSKFLYDRKLIKYLLVVILASLFHSSSLIMILFYFILNLRFNTKNFILIFSASLIITLYLDSILMFVQKFFYSVYTGSSYGMTGLSFTNAVLPIALLIFSFFHYKKIDLNNTMQRVWLNAIIFYTFFSILGLQVQMIQRLSGFFAPYVLLLVPMIFSKMKKNELKVIYMLGLLSLLLLYNFITLSGTGYDPYYFIWDTRR